MPVLGLKGDGAWSSDERPNNYRQYILFLQPNGMTPLTGFMSKLKQEVTDDPKFNIFQKGLPTQKALVSGSQTSGDTTIELQGSNQNTLFKPGHAVLNLRTFEIIWITASSVANTLTVIRGKGGSAAAAMNDGDELFIIGSHHEEGASVPTAIAYDPTVVYNYTQIFRNSLFLTRTATKTRLRTGDAIREAKREALELHAIEMEKAFLFGDRQEVTSGTLGQPDRTTRGFYNYISTNVKDFSAGVDVDSWENFMEDVFENGSTEKLFLCGNRALNVLNKLGRAHYHVEVTPGDQTYGVQMLTYVTPFGTLQLKTHPLLSASATFNSWGFVVDPSKIVYRFLTGSDTTYKENCQTPGDDAMKNEFITEAGFELQFEECHGVAKTMSTFIP